MLSYIKRKIAQRKAIRELHELSDYQLRDLGISRYDINRVIKMANA